MAEDISRERTNTAGESTVCRLCLKSDDYYLNIFTSNSASGVAVQDIIKDLLNVEVAENDGLPVSACLLCVRKVMEYSDFKSICLKSYAALRKYAPAEYLKNDPAKKTDLNESVAGESANEGVLSGGNESRETELPNVVPLGMENMVKVKEEVNSSESWTEEEAERRNDLDEDYYKEMPLEVENMVIVKEEVDPIESVSETGMCIQEDLSQDERAASNIPPRLGTLMILRGRKRKTDFNEEVEWHSSSLENSQPSTLRQGPLPGTLPSEYYAPLKQECAEEGIGDMLEGSEEEPESLDFSGESDYGDSAEDSEEELPPFSGQSWRSPALDPKHPGPCPSLPAAEPVDPFAEPSGPCNATWSRDSARPKHFAYIENSGLINPPYSMEPIDFFRLLLPDSLVHSIVDQTNEFADHLMQANAPPKAKLGKWKPLTYEEFLIFVGLLFHMGTIPLSRLSDYWNTDILFNLPCFRKCMSRDRFFYILQALHFSPNPNPEDTLCGVQPLLDSFHSIMDSIVIPSRQLCIDQSTLLWSGRYRFHNPMKYRTNKQGIKLFMLTETSGLVLRLLVHTGGEGSELKRRGRVDSIVHNIMDGHLDKGHSLFMDHHYTSVDLIRTLLERKTHCTGTLRANRKGNPPEVVRAKLQRGEVVDAYTNDGICVFKWKYNVDTLMISSEFRARMVDVPSRRDGVVSKPEAVVKYKESMGGINLCDQMMVHYPIERKSIKWNKKLGIHIFNLMLVNSFFIFQKYSEKTPILDFRLSVIKSLILPTYSKNSKPVYSWPSFHFPQIHLDVRKKKIFRRCRHCSSQGLRKETAYFCPDCEGHPRLCVECFTGYHARFAKN